MAKYTKNQYKQVTPRRWKVHPIWRGIGAILMVLVPVLSLIGAYMLVRANFDKQWIAVPADLMKSVNFDLLLRILPELSGTVKAIGRIYYIDLVLFVLFMVVGFGLVSIIYGFFYSAVGPSRYGPVDAPPVRKSPTSAARYK